MNQIFIHEIDHIFNDLNLIKKINPMIHNITNWVVMQNMKNRYSV